MEGVYGNKGILHGEFGKRKHAEGEGAKSLQKDAKETKEGLRKLNSGRWAVISGRYGSIGERRVDYAKNRRKAELVFRTPQPSGDSHAQELRTRAEKSCR